MKPSRPVGIHTRGPLVGPPTSAESTVDGVDEIDGPLLGLDSAIPVCDAMDGFAAPMVTGISRPAVGPVSKPRLNSARGIDSEAVSLRASMGPAVRAAAFGDVAPATTVSGDCTAAEFSPRSDWEWRAGLDSVDAVDGSSRAAVDEASSIGAEVGASGRIDAPVSWRTDSAPRAVEASERGTATARVSLGRAGTAAADRGAVGFSNAGATSACKIQSVFGVGRLSGRSAVRRPRSSSAAWAAGALTSGVQARSAAS